MLLPGPAGYARTVAHRNYVLNLAPMKGNEGHASAGGKVLLLVIGTNYAD